MLLVIAQPPQDIDMIKLRKLATRPCKQRERDGGISISRNEIETMKRNANFNFFLLSYLISISSAS